MFYMWMTDTPVGRILLAGESDCLRFLVFDNEKSLTRHKLPGDTWEQNESPFREVIRQLKAYFSGKLRSFDVPVQGAGTDFQQEVWRALLDVPYGETRSYGEIANSIGNPKAVRAVGAANGRNPIAIVVPCHRVIGSDGTLTGFGGGLPRKQYLLNLEGAGQGELSL